jgi:hypothetical protein
VIAGAAAAVVSITLVVVGPLAWQVGGHTVSSLHGKARADAIDAVRQTLLAAATGLAALSALLFTARSFYLNRRGQLTDRYAKSVSLLASDQIAERIGGVYALEHLMKESPADHDTVVQVPAAFIRERCPSPSDTATLREIGRVSNEAAQPRCPADAQAALTVLGALHGVGDTDSPARTGAARVRAEGDGLRPAGSIVEDAEDGLPRSGTCEVDWCNEDLGRRVEIAEVESGADPDEDRGHGALTQPPAGTPARPPSECADRWPSGATQGRGSSTSRAPVSVS